MELPGYDAINKKSTIKWRYDDSYYTKNIYDNFTHGRLN